MYFSAIFDPLRAQSRLLIGSSLATERSAVPGPTSDSLKCPSLSLLLMIQNHLHVLDGIVPHSLTPDVKWDCGQ